MKYLTKIVVVAFLLAGCERPGSRQPSQREIERALKKQGLNVVHGDLHGELRAGQRLADRLREADLVGTPSESPISQCKLLTDEKSIALIVYGLKTDKTQILEEVIREVMDEFKLRSIELLREYVETTPEGSFLRNDATKYTRKGSGVSAERLGNINSGMRSEITTTTDQVTKGNRKERR